MVIRSLLACVLAGLLAGAAAAQPADAPSLDRRGRALLDQVRAHEPAVAAPAASLVSEALRRRHTLAGRVGPGVIWVEARQGEDLDRFFQDDDFYYLSGVEIPDVALALRVDEAGEVADDVLFLPQHDPRFERWNGPRASPGPEATASSRFGRTLPLAEREAWLAAAGARMLYVPGAALPVVPEGMAVNRTLLRQLLDSMRLVKSEYELTCLRNAIAITTAGLRNALYEVRPGAFEYAVQGAIEGTFLRLGAERAGFGTICGSGPNTVVLHYNANRRQMQAGDLLVMDVGAKYRYYCADVTRTVPVSGTFTPRQREVYDVVLRAQAAAAQAARPGMTMGELDAVARAVIREAGFGPYFQHGLGHWIGLDVHDVGGRAPMLPGTVFTIEPGIYIAEEGLGVRIEDDFLMTVDGAVKLSGAMPSDPDRIEDLLAPAA